VRSLAGRIHLAVMHERPGRRRLGLVLAVASAVVCVAIQAMWWNPLGLLVLEPVSDENVVLSVYAVAFDPGPMRVSHWLRSCDEEGGLCWMPV
jgi:hypothetical protein